MKSWPCLFVLIAGCSSVPSATPTWSLPITSSSLATGVVPMQAGLGLDGEVVVVARDASIGGSDAAGGHVVRVSRQGTVTSAVPFDIGDSLPLGVKVDDAGRAVVALGFGTGGYRVVAFDAADGPRWSQPVIAPTQSTATCCTLRQGVFDVARDGSVVVAELTQGGAASTRMLNGDGSDRWANASLPGAWVAFVGALDSGNVIATTGPTVELDASDGHMLATSPIIGTAMFRQTRHDGTTAAWDNSLGHNDDIVLFEPSGTERWRSQVPIGRCPSRNYCPSPPLEPSQYVLLAPDDHVVVANEVTKVSVLAAATGDEVATVEHGDAPSMIGADADGYVVVERTNDGGGLVLARYPYPR